jgi:hypothetical protein
MPVPGKVAVLPEDVREELNQKLIAAGFGKCEELSDWLFEKGFEISKTTVNEHAKKLKRRLATITASTETAKILAKAAPDEADDRSNAIIAMIQSELFEALLGMEEAVETVDKVDRIGLLNKVAKNIATLTRASVARNKWAAEVQKKVLLEAAARVESAAQARGLTAEDARFWREQVLMGI